MWSSWWNEIWQGKPKYSEKTCPSVTSSITNLTWHDVGSNSGRRGGKPATCSSNYAKDIQMALWDVTILQLTFQFRSLRKNIPLTVDIQWNRGLMYRYTYKNGFIEVLSMETVTRDRNCLFRKFRPLSAFEVIQNAAWIRFIVMLVCHLKKNREKVCLTEFI
jgi:hypothetical protein